MRHVFILFAFLTCLFTGVYGVDVQLPKEERVKCKNMSHQQIMDYLTSIAINSLHAEIASRDSTLLLAYIEHRPQNCVAVIYTIKFVISAEEFTYALYYGVTARDNTDECQHDVFEEMNEVERRLRQLLRL